MDSSERDNATEVQRDGCVADESNLNQPREEETLRERTLSRNSVFENPSLHEEDASAPLWGAIQRLQQESTDMTSSRSFARRSSNPAQFDRRLSCLSILCLLSLVLACILLISGKKVLQRVGGGLFGVAIILCVAMIVESILHSSSRRQMPHNEQRRRQEIVIEPPPNFDISQARTEWCMSSIEVLDKDSPPSYNSIISAPLVDQKPNKSETERNNPYFKYFSASLFSPTDCESCEDVVNPPPSYESLVELFLKSSTQRDSDNVEQTEVNINGNSSILPDQETSRDHVVDMNT